MVRTVLKQYEDQEVEVRGICSVRYPKHESGKFACGVSQIIVNDEVVASVDHVNVYPKDYQDIQVPDVHWDIKRGDIVKIVGVVGRYHKRSGIDYCIRNPRVEVIGHV